MKRREQIRIGIDGYNLALVNGTGVATYGRTLVHAARAAGYGVNLIFGVNIPKIADPALREVMFFSALNEDPPAPLKPTMRRRLKRLLLSPQRRVLDEIPRTGAVMREAFGDRLPTSDRLFNFGSLFTVAIRYFRRYGRFMPISMPDPPDIMHWTYPVPVRMLGAKNIYTIHDLVPLRLPQASTEDKRYHMRLIQECLKADQVVTVSRHSLNDILLSFPEATVSRITNTYQSVLMDDVAPDFPHEDLEQRLAQFFGLKLDGYFLYYGALEPKKNIGRLLEAYVSSDIQAPLVLVGAKSWRSEQELRLLNQAQGALPALGRIHQFGYLPKAMLMLLVRGAKAVVMPSIYEGFGLPVLEALSAGTPVLTANCGSLAEIAGPAYAVEVDPFSVASIREGLLALDEDETLRGRLRIAGPLRADQFSHDRYRVRLEELYERILLPSYKPSLFPFQLIAWP